jgi:asparagine synthase (glutamine-hydrolysing)
MRLPFIAGVLGPAGGGSSRALAEAVGHDTAALGTEAPGAPAIVGVGDAIASARDEGGGFCVVLGDGDPASILRRWRERDAQVLDDVRGEFVVLLWDAERRRGLLARDRMGVWSLFLARAAGALHFSSEQHHLLRTLPTRPAPDAEGVGEWLAHGEVAGARTLYEGVTRLPPAHAITLGEGAGDPWRYWSPTPPRALVHGRDAVAAEARRVIEDAIAERLPRDGAAGVLLSGGLDSSSVAGLAAVRAERDGTRLRAYSAVFPDHPEMDEGPLIAQVVERLGLRGAEIRVRGGSPLSGALEYTAAFGLPLVSPSHFLWLPLLRRAAEDGVTVMLDGEGGDELFRAAPHLLADRLARGRVLAALRLTRSLPGAGTNPPWRGVFATIRHLALPALVPAPVMRARDRRRAGEPDHPAWLTASTAASLAEADPVPRSGPRWWRQLAEPLVAGRERHGVHAYLRHRAALAGIESRSPLLDERLTDLMLRADPEAAFTPERDRPVLRETVAGLVPDAVRLRFAKSYFEGMLANALAGDDRAALDRLLGPDAQLGRWIDLPRARALLLDRPPDRHPEGAGRWLWETWRLAATEVWLRHELAPDDLRGLREPGLLGASALELVAR